MMARYARWIAGLTTVAVVACDPCTGTSSCDIAPRLSYSGRIIERQSGRAVAGVRLELIRRDGIALAADTTRATSDHDGFFIIRSDADGLGTVIADLRVLPGPPYPEYTARGLQLTTTDRAGDGGILGRLVVNPYLQLIGEVRNGRTDSVIAGAKVVVRPRNPTKLVAEDSLFVVTSDNGRFLYQPTIIAYDSLDLEFEIRPADGIPGPELYVRRLVAPQFLDGDPQLLVLYIGRSIRYVGLASRRGTGEYIPGTAVDFVRSGGPSLGGALDSLHMPIGSNGEFKINLDLDETGTVTGSLRILPPPPLVPETIPDIQLHVRDDAAFSFLGHLGYGPGATLQATFRRRSTGAPLTGVHVRPFRVGGLPVLAPPQSGPTSDQLIRVLDVTGTFSHTFGTPDTGQIVIDIEVRLPRPLAWDTVRAVALPSRLSNVPTALSFLVGPP